MSNSFETKRQTKAYPLRADERLEALEKELVEERRRPSIAAILMGFLILGLVLAGITMFAGAGKRFTSAAGSVDSQHVVAQIRTTQTHSDKAV